MSASRSLRLNRRAAGGLAGVLALGLSTAAAGQDMLDTLQLHGFLSQGWVTTDHNNFFGPSRDGGGSFKFTEIAANASLRPHHDLLLSAQVLSRRAGGDGRDARPKLDHGVVDYQFVSSASRTLGLQAGRFKNPFGLHNQTRDVPFARPGILLPQSIYFDRARSLALAADGGTVYLEERIPDGGALRAQVGFGRVQADDDLERTLRLDPVPGGIEPRDSVIGQLLYEHDGGRIIAALSAARVKARFERDGARDGQFDFQPWIVSFQYNEALWDLTAEFAVRESSMEGLADIGADFDITGESWYVQYTRRFHPDWQWLIRYDSLVSDRSDRSGRDFAAATGLPAHARFAHDWTLGLRWQPHPKVQLGAEYHYVDGTGWLPTEDNPDPSDTRRRWNMLLMQLSLRY
ncbi:hypothetical protein ACN2MM_06195 [Alkalilimnicola ehrlichii MLHE-1]|uniref:hypothetical protein n=1 Tax=Alkalilimnicola ehrlichii TaxID=351052 RepID=UPI00005DF337|nr:hypothetical protein [Alkalilimnicola ehrlichii]